MTSSSEEKITINKKLLERMIKYVDSSFCEFNVVDNETLSLSQKEYNKIRNLFSMKISDKLINSVSDIKSGDLKELDKLYNNYINITYNEIRNKANQEKGIRYTKEELIELGLKVLDKVEEIKQIPSVINEIKQRIREIRISDISSPILSIDKEFKDLVEKGGSLKDYETIKTFLDIILRKTYIGNITKIYSNDINNKSDINLLVSEDDNGYLLTKDNIANFTYGLILNPEDIVCAHNIGDDKNLFLSFNHIDKNDNEIIVKDAKPSAIYAVTIGERDLNNNYNCASKLLEKYPNIPLIEIDLNKYLSKEDIKEYINGFIDELIEEKGVVFNNKDESFYRNFDKFYDEFLSIKSGPFDRTNIINLFEHNYNLLYGPIYDDLNNVFTNQLTDEEIMYILKNHISHEDFIFRYKLITFEMLNRFCERYKDYKDNEIFNRICPGINAILFSIENGDENKLHSLVELYNNSESKDTWLISNLFDPKHKIDKSELKVKEIAESIQMEYDGEQEFVDFLKSNDEDKRTRQK